MRRAIELPNWIKAGFAAIAALLCVTLAVCYALQPDACVVLTIWPPWLWLLPGLLLAGLAWDRERKRVSGAVALVWLAFLLTFAEEPRSLVRGAVGSISGSQIAGRATRLRVTSLNCGGGSPAAAAEVQALSPNLVLLQETPTRQHVQKLGAELFGAAAAEWTGLDDAILAQGPLSPRPLPRGTSHFVAAKARLEGIGAVEVVSLRLIPPVVRFDLWSPGCWRDYTVNRQLRREQLREVADYLATIPPVTPIILGGDFNAPAGDAIFRLLRPRLHDAFVEGGVGWGNTALNDIPVSRIDQIWVSRQFHARAVWARRTLNSDHRMVVADLAYRN
jgi:hypothetical protein